MYNKHSIKAFYHQCRIEWKPATPGLFTKIYLLLLLPSNLSVTDNKRHNASLSMARQAFWFENGNVGVKTDYGEEEKKLKMYKLFNYYKYKRMVEI